MIVKPEMSAPEVTEQALEAVRSGKYDDGMILNYANCDMVGHTGVMAGGRSGCQRGGSDVGILVDEIAPGRALDGPTTATPTR